MDVTTLVKANTTDRSKLTCYGNGVLDITEKLVSALVRKTDTMESINISLQTLGMEHVGKHSCYKINLQSGTKVCKPIGQNEYNKLHKLHV